MVKGKKTKHKGKDKGNPDVRTHGQGRSNPTLAAVGGPSNPPPPPPPPPADELATPPPPSEASEGGDGGREEGRLDELDGLSMDGLNLDDSRVQVSPIPLDDEEINNLLGYGDDNVKVDNVDDGEVVREHLN